MGISASPCLAGIVLGIALGFPVPARPQPTGPAAGTANAELSLGVAANRANNPDTALVHFRRALELAREERSRSAEGRALWGVGHTLLRLDRYAEARAELEAAIKLLDDPQVRSALAYALQDLGVAHFFLNDRATALTYYEKALAHFEALGNIPAQADAYHSLSLSAPNTAARMAYLEKGLLVAEKSANPLIIGAFLHSWSDGLFDQARYAEAMDKIREAIAHFERPGDAGRLGLANSLTSLGRIYRVHGQHERAVEAYQRAYRLHEQIKNLDGMIQSLNALGVASGYLKRQVEQRSYYERALALARSIGSARRIELASTSLADVLVGSGDVLQVKRGIELLTELDTEKSGNYLSLNVLALGHSALGEYRRAVELTDRAVTVARAGGHGDLLYNSFAIRSHARDKLGDTPSALADAQEALALIEQSRAGAVPTDSMKSGFAGQYERVFTSNIALLHRLGRHQEALDVAERARARGFADLLASRAPVTITQSVLVAATDSIGPAPLERASALPTRGSTGLGVASGSALPGDLRSAAAIDPLTSTELAALARRLDSTIVTYWVGADHTYVWVVRGSGRVDSVRVDTGETRIRDLVIRARSVGAGRPSRSADSDASAEAAAAGADAGWVPRLRGAGLLTLGNDAVLAARALHALLVRPIEPFLPTARGSLLTIVPHGPLFLLSFASLQDASGQYLLERHAIHYAPAGVVLQLTDRQKRAAAVRRSSYLLIGDPASLPASSNGRPLPRLPGTATEVKGIADVAERSAVRTLIGSKATEPDVRRLAGESTVLHFATHGVINPDDPLESFLALDTGESSGTRSAKGAGPRPIAPPLTSDRDGRLTAREIYDLRLSADLVVLSACETALGRISGDGVAGLARAFVYAGTSSVVATLWDIADEPAARLMPDFHRALRRQSDTARALRSAQLKLLGDLRAGRVSVDTPSGPIALPEHPVLWAGFMLFGER